MAKLIKLNRSEIKEGEIFNRWLNNRLIRRNQNILVAVTGATGSGKSYICLRLAELWYNHHFQKPYPIKNVCFSVREAMELLSSGNLKRGELIILEEAGVNIGSLDFQNKVSKLFMYVLQSFRSMNVGILFNLPVLSMMNKSARLLIHCNMITSGIDYQTKQTAAKVFFHQLNQQSGKVYYKYIRARINGSSTKIKRFMFQLPSDDLRKGYESKKLNFVVNFSKDFTQDLGVLNKKELRRREKRELSDKQKEVYDLAVAGKNPKEIAEILNKSTKNVYEALRRAKSRGFVVKKRENRIGNDVFYMSSPLPTAV